MAGTFQLEALQVADLQQRQPSREEPLPDPGRALALRLLENPGIQAYEGEAKSLYGAIHFH
jgi:hypothetical protein